MSRAGGKKNDYLAIVEAAYALELPEQEWVQGIAEAARPIIDRGFGVLSYTYDASVTSRVQMGAFSQAGGQFPLEEGARAFTATLGAEQVRPFYNASPPTEFLHRIFRRFPPTDRTVDVLTKGPAVVNDALGIRGHNPDHRGCVITATSEGPSVLAPRTRAALDRVALHLAAGYRLRSRKREALSQADAIFSAKGKLEHCAEEVANTRSLLDDAVQRRLVGQRVRSAEPERALELWRALVDGYWSVVDHVDRDGKRFILARRNDAHLENPMALDRKERLVALYSSWGHSNKLVAYELGLSPSTVSALLHSALKKLRLRSRSDLLRILGGP